MFCNDIISVDDTSGCARMTLAVSSDQPYRVRRSSQGPSTTLFFPCKLESQDKKKLNYTKSKLDYFHANLNSIRHKITSFEASLNSQKRKLKFSKT